MATKENRGLAVGRNGAEIVSLGFEIGGDGIAALADDEEFDYTVNDDVDVSLRVGDHTEVSYREESNRTKVKLTVEKYDLRPLRTRRVIHMTVDGIDVTVSEKGELFR